MEIQVKKRLIAQCEPDGELNPSLVMLDCMRCLQAPIIQNEAGKNNCGNFGRVLNAPYEPHSSVFSLEPVTVK